MLKVTHVITGLNTGGAEIMLYRLLSHLDKTTVQSNVISLTDIGPVGKKIEALGIPVFALGMARNKPNPVAILHLTNLLRQHSPHVVQSWLYHADLFGGLAAKLAGNIPVCWGIHMSNLESQGHKETTLWVLKICAKLSPWIPKKIISCSEAGRQRHVAVGYIATKMMFIPNGFDGAIFKPNSKARVLVRQELNLPSNSLLIGLVARFDPQKDHHNFIKAATELLFYQPDVKFVLCGDGITWENNSLRRWIEEAKIRDAFYLLGRREDIPQLQASFDIATISSSYGEAFPLVVGEAMACGTPCVVTDVGDSALIVGHTGRVVPPEDPQSLATGWRELLALPYEARRLLGQQARARILENFELRHVATRYQKLWQEVAANKNL